MSVLDIRFGTSISAAATFGTELTAVVLAAITAFVTTIAAAPIRLAVDRRLQRSKVEIEYDHEQRKALRAKIGEYHGRLLDAAAELHYRLVNLNLNQDQGWLAVDGEFRTPAATNHYFRTTAFRFVRLEGLANKFEREAIFVDARIADGTDEAFVFYAKAFRWAMTAVELFRDLGYDASQSAEHFFNDHLRQMCRTAWGQQDDLSFGEFESLLVRTDDLDELLRFFDGLTSGTRRWDRLMVLQLLLMAFINTFGYASQRVDDPWFDRVVNQIERESIVVTLLEWLPKLGLHQDSGSIQLAHALRRRVAPMASEQ